MGDGWAALEFAAVWTYANLFGSHTRVCVCVCAVEELSAIKMAAADISPNLVILFAGVFA